MSRFAALFEPVAIGGMTVKNRIVLSPMGTSLANSNGEINDRFLSFYTERAKGGVGYITIGNTCVHPSGKATDKMVCLYNDSHVQGFSRLADAVHREGGKIIVQLNHAGRQTLSKLTGQKIVAPSSIPCRLMKETPHALDIHEIRVLVEAFSESTLKAKSAGCDGVEFHMAHGYLICQFLSPFSNQRTDDYGGTVEKRCRFAVEIVKRTREKTGPEFPIICRISADEWVEGGLKPEESKQIARILEMAGADAIHVSACNYESYAYNMPCYYQEDGCFADLAAIVKSVVSIPVIAVGKIKTPELAEEIVSSGKADLIAMARPLIADPYWPQKIDKNEVEAIRPCLSCNICVESISRTSLECGVNPYVGNEDQQIKRSDSKPQKVLVIGGGPAGMEVARSAALLGHQVVLYEADAQLGGQLNGAAIPPGKSGFRQLVNYYEQILFDLKVKINLNSRCSMDTVKKEHPDLVIVAAGPSSGDTAFVKNDKVISIKEGLTNPEKLGNKVLIIGGGPKGAEFADYLATSGKEVTVLEQRRKIGFGLPSGIRFHLEKRIKESSVQLLLKTQLVEINDHAVKIRSAGVESMLDGFDAIVPAMGESPNADIVDDLKQGDIPVWVIGDAREPKGIKEAIAQGASIFRKKTM